MSRGNGHPASMRAPIAHVSAYSEDRVDVEQIHRRLIRVAK